MTNPNFAIEDVAFSCNATTANGETCPYTCPDGFEPAADTDPVCVAAGWKFNWVEGTGGLPECVSAAPAGEYALESTHKRMDLDGKIETFADICMTWCLGCRVCMMLAHVTQFRNTQLTVLLG